MARTRKQSKVRLETKVSQIRMNEEAQLELQQNKPRFSKFEPRSRKQEQLVTTLNSFRLVFIKGPAGTGKTFVPTSLAVEALMAKQIDRIVITRPQVGCDEEMGFEPGTEDEKFAGWIRPFVDIIEGKVGKSRMETLFKYEKIIASPLSKMRGSTFRNSYVILDEAQNTTVGQMKMFLTRIGEGTRVVVNGDTDQSDLPGGVVNGLEDALSVIGNSRNVSIFNFTEDDIVRDPLVKDIIIAYRRRYQRQKASNNITLAA